MASLLQTTGHMNSTESSSPWTTNVPPLLVNVTMKYMELLNGTKSNNFTSTDVLPSSSTTTPSEDILTYIETSSPSNSSETPSLLALTSNSTYHYYGLGIVLPMSTILTVAMIMATVGNIMVILTIIRHKAMRTRTNMFIINLAVADILVAIFDMPFSIITMIKGEWIFGDAMCAFNGYTMSLFMMASVHTLMYISIHKYISITKPFSKYMTTKRILVMIAITWIWSTSYSTASALGWNRSIYKTGATQCGPSYPDNTLKKTHSLCNTIFNLLLPYTIMTFCYYNIFREIRRHMSRMRETTNLDAKNSLMQQKRVSTTLFIVLVCFLLCWFPYLAYSSYAAFVKDKRKVPIVANPLAYWFGYINSACNPVIYAFRSPSFRQGYYSIVCGHKQRRFSTSGGSFSRNNSSRNQTLQASLNKNVNPNGTAEPAEAGAPEKKRRPKRLISMNSWASIVVPLSPIRKTPPAAAKRQFSEDCEPTTCQPFLQPPDGPGLEHGSSITDLTMDAAMIVLAPILESQVEEGASTTFATAGSGPDGLTEVESKIVSLSRP